MYKNKIIQKRLKSTLSKTDNHNKPKRIRFGLENCYTLLFNFQRFQGIVILAIAMGLLGVFSVVL